MRILVLLHEAFGGRGGIAKFNRDLLTALASHSATACVTALPRFIDEPARLADARALAPRLDYRRAAAHGKLAFLLAELALLPRRHWFDLVICGHLRLLPLLAPLGLRRSSRLGLVLHGIEAWEPSEGPFTRLGLDRLDWFLAVSAITKERFLGWSGLPPERGFVVPNAVELARFTPGPARADLLARLGLGGRRVLMSLGRLAAGERYKGIDEVLEVMPTLLRTVPDLAYLIAGEGDDRARLEAKVRALGLAERVVFAGYVPEAEKADYYRLADCFLLAGWGEGFGIVLLEAMACGIPVVASRLDGSCEAVADGALGLLVNPREPADLLRGIETALASPRGIPPPGLERFSYRAFEERVHRLILEPILPQGREIDSSRPAGTQ